ncbi:MAG TPA: hypothetical protein VJP78_12300 [Thermoleophilia bacterium]|nr:hypothetical protein [Thermoleophilia bacterium]
MGGEWDIVCVKHREILETGYRHLWAKDYDPLPKNAMALLREEFDRFYGPSKRKCDDRFLEIVEAFLERHERCHVNAVNRESDEFAELGLGSWTVGWKEFDTGVDRTLILQSIPSYVSYLHERLEGNRAELMTLRESVGRPSPRRKMRNAGERSRALEQDIAWVEQKLHQVERNPFTNCPTPLVWIREHVAQIESRLGPAKDGRAMSRANRWDRKELAELRRKEKELTAWLKPAEINVPLELVKLIREKPLYVAGPTVASDT